MLIALFRGSSLIGLKANLYATPVTLFHSLTLKMIFLEVICPSDALIQGLFVFIVFLILYEVCCLSCEMRYLEPSPL